MQKTDQPVLDVRDWIERAEALGELVRITGEVDPVEEMSAITYIAAKLAHSPALLFESPSAQGIRHLWNILGPSVSRSALTLGEPTDTPTMALIEKVRSKIGRRIPPVTIDIGEAPIYENTISDTAIDLTQLPIPKHWPRDGGKYAGTADAVITRGTDTGTINIGTYRMMLQGPRHVSVSIAPGKDALHHIHQAWRDGKPLHIVAAWGVDPLLMIVGSQSFPSDVSEFEVAGGIRNSPIRVVPAKHSDLLIPADAEFVIEGLIQPGSTRTEGPFGEFTGYYGYPDENSPLVEVLAVHHRNNPILTNALMADFPSNEQGAFFSTIRSARIWAELTNTGLAGIHGVYCHPAAAGAFAMTIISIKQMYPGHAAQALALAAQTPAGAYISKWIIAVDDDIDPSDMDQVIWAMSTRATPSDDIDVLRNTRGSPLDPAQTISDRMYGSKALINACRDHRIGNDFPKRTLLRSLTYRRVVSRWQQLGLPGSPPHVSIFDTNLEDQ